MKSVFLIAAFNAILFTVLLSQKKPRAQHDNILLIWLLYLAVYIGLYAFYSHELFVHLRLLSVSMVSLLMLHGPFLYLYISLLASGKDLNAKDLLHLVPFALFNIYILTSSLIPELRGRLSLENISPGDDPPLLFSFFLILTAFSGTLYFLLTFRLFKKLDLNISNNFSSSARIDLSWIRRLVFIFGIVWTVLISVTIIHHIFGMFTMVFCTDGLFLSLSAFLILIGYFGLKQKVIFTNDNLLVSAYQPGRARYSGSRLTSEESKKYAMKLLDYMKSEKPYLDPELSLPALSNKLDISGHYLSQVINEQFNLNFFDFINKYRVEEFREKVADPSFENFSLLGIAFDCGFNSKSAFNRIFKETTGLTPSQYKKSVQEAPSVSPV